MKLTGSAVLLLGIFALASCEKKKSDAAPAASAAPIPDTQIATSSDFEETAAKEINDDNAETELAKIEKEVSQ